MLHSPLLTTDRCITGWWYCKTVNTIPIVINSYIDAKNHTDYQLTDNGFVLKIFVNFNYSYGIADYVVFADNVIALIEEQCVIHTFDFDGADKIQKAFCDYHKNLIVRKLKDYQPDNYSVNKIGNNTYQIKVNDTELGKISDNLFSPSSGFKVSKKVKKLYFADDIDLDTKSVLVEPYKPPKSGGMIFELEKYEEDEDFITITYKVKNLDKNGNIVNKYPYVFEVDGVQYVDEDILKG